jgi:hypothetical protein
MTNYRTEILPPDGGELTPAQLLTAELVALGQQFPTGQHVASEIRLAKAVPAVEKLFTEHGLPFKAELTAELTLWRCHLEEGQAFPQRCEELLSAVLRRVAPVDRQQLP